MQNRIPELYLILKKRLSEEEILKKAEVHKELLNKKQLLENIDNDQLAISIYFKLYSTLTNSELIAFLSRDKVALKDDSKGVLFKESKLAFSEAIQSGLLSADSGKTNFAGFFMYMGTWSNRDHFKNIRTREYVS
jgi:hypothetical protein